MLCRCVSSPARINVFLSVPLLLCTLSFFLFLCSPTPPPSCVMFPSVSLFSSWSYPLPAIYWLSNPAPTSKLVVCEYYLNVVMVIVGEVLGKQNEKEQAVLKDLVVGRTIIAPQRYTQPNLWNLYMLFIWQRKFM